MADTMNAPEGPFDAREGEEVTVVTGDNIVLNVGESEEQKRRRAERDASVRRLAEQLGVEPISGDDPDSMVIFHLSTGERYSWEQMLFAHIDLMKRTAE